KGSQDKSGRPIFKKDWYDVKAPAVFNVRNIGETFVTRPQGTKIISDGLKGCEDEVALRKFKLITEDVRVTKYAPWLKKWQIMIEAHVDVKTVDGYLHLLFCVGFTKKYHQQIHQTCKRLMEIMHWKKHRKFVPTFPFHDVSVRKVKMGKKPKFEFEKLMELHGEGSSSGKATGHETGTKAEQTDGYEPPL
ncbi:hypothetical protein FD754_014978, partial [Muntiacus muntjak]